MNRARPPSLPARWPLTKTLEMREGDAVATRDFITDIKLPWKPSLRAALTTHSIGHVPSRYVAGQLVSIRNHRAAPSVGIVVYDYGRPSGLLVSRYNVYRDMWGPREQVTHDDITGPLETQ